MNVSRWASARRALLVALLATLVANIGAIGATLHWTGTAWLSQMELAAHHAWIASQPIRVDPSILLVTIQKNTPEQLNIASGGLPLPRWYHAVMITALRDAGARAVLLDLLFLDPHGEREDAILADALARSAPLPVTVATEAARAEARPEAPTGWDYWFARPVALPEPLPANVTVASAVAFDPGHSLEGVILLRPDRNSGRWIPHVALSAALGALGMPVPRAGWQRSEHRVTAGPYSWPVGYDGELHLRWPARKHPFPAVEYAEALARLDDPGLRGRFRNRIVIVADDTGADLHPTPIGQINGGEFVAHVVNNLLASETRGSGRWGVPAVAAWSFLLALLAALAIGTLRRGVIAVGLLGTLGAAALVPGAAELGANLWIDTVAPVAAVAVAATLAALLEAPRAGTMARRFVPAHVREDRAAHPTEEATVMFVDLRGSVALSERLGPDAAREVFSDLLGRLAGVVERHGGEVERTLGDGLMAVFREQRRASPHALRCVAAAAELREEMRPVDAALRERCGAGAELTVGIEAGTISGAVISAAGHEEWSSFGPTVNLAARLQHACGDAGRSVLIGPGAWAAIRSSIPTVFAGDLCLRGIEGEVPAYTLAGPVEGGE